MKSTQWVINCPKICLRKKLVWDAVPRTTRMEAHTEQKYAIQQTARGTAATLYMLMNASRRGVEWRHQQTSSNGALSLRCHRNTQYREGSAALYYSLFVVFETWQTHDWSDRRAVGRTDGQTDTVQCTQQRMGKGHSLGTHTHSRRMSHSRLGSCNYVQTTSRSSALPLDGTVTKVSPIRDHISRAQ
jgi:hypothetical protein